ncbi:MAG: transposase, partial [Desulfovibrio sp.]|uniref:transposase n=1 Tax=Desulfovibrio sp. TaxID=885 RepID=UPI002A9125AA
MKQTDFRDVPDELGERIEPLLTPFTRKRSGGSKPLAQRTVLAGILYKCRTGCQWAMLPACYGKALSTNTSNAGTKPVSWR